MVTHTADVDSNIRNTMSDCGESCADFQDELVMRWGNVPFNIDDRAKVSDVCNGWVGRVLVATGVGKRFD